MQQQQYHHQHRSDEEMERNTSNPFTKLLKVYYTVDRIIGKYFCFEKKIFQCLDTFCALKI